MGKNKWLFLLFLHFWLYSVGTYAQSKEIILGLVLDKDTGRPIPSATVQLLDTSDSSMVGFTIARVDGNFTIPIQELKDYLLKISSLGYGSKFIAIQPGQVSEEVKVFLEKEDIKLNEVIILESSPAVVRHDTTIYQVDKYMQEGDRSLFEVLKNMPNFRVEESGEVFFKNKRIDKVMLDGDDLIGENYKAAIKSMDPSVLNEVQVIENFQDNRFLSGVEAGQKTVLNLGVKEDRKQLLFGNLELGLGPEAHNGLANIFSYQGKFKAYLLGTSNNAGIRREDQSAERKVEELSNFAKDWLWSPLQHINRYIPYFLKTTYENPNRERLGTINLSYRAKDNISLVSNFNLYADRNDFLKENATEFLLDQPFRIRQADTLFRRPRMIEHRLKGDIALDNQTGIRIDNLLHFHDNFLGQSLFFDGGNFVENRIQEMTNRRNTWNAVMELTRKIGENNALVFGVFTRRETMHESLNASLLVEQNNTIEEVQDISQFLDHQMLQSGVQLRWLKSGKSIRFENQLSYHHQEYSLNGELQGEEDGLVGIFSRTPSFYQKLTLEKGKINLNFSYRIEKQLMETFLDESKSRWNWQRDAVVLVKLDDDNVINVGFSIEVQPLYGSAMADRPLFLDFRTAQQGKNLIDWNRQVNFFFGHHYSDIFKRRISVNTNLFWLRNPTLWTLNAMELRPEIVFMRLGRTTLNDSKGIMVKVDKLVYPIRGNVRLDLNLWQSGFEEIVNGLERFSSSITPSVGYRYSSAFKGPVNVEFKGYFQQNRMNILQGDEVLKNNFMNSNQTLILRSKFGKMTGRLILENFGIEKENFQFVNYRIEYNMRERLNFYTEGRNLLNTDSFTMARFTPNQFFQESYSLLGRIILVGINWYF
ncbi:carboxypeptidase-like regulatory domain-containing protein [Cecembia lonarensis]|uniref:Outer membrane protein beta-barrel domain-containing protein n=1 Tax=Cecembia lonarensis (strain CCUG 58316 / KCTC 22772 / LW9) TaxID=1225176 RepID=K1LBJ5_CECL9|nr:carboxypeptidase-like regulatory domain-containing protein [Cecembia lonarensis]EKB49627.1 hypothetical protein B879_01740 [Cecembia lonarensis LW9]